MTGSPSARFCAQIIGAAAAPLPEPVAGAARRSLFNVLGTAAGAARSPAVEAIVATALGETEPAGPAALAPVPGRAETLSPHWAALATGTAAHLDDFDDTHLATVIHPGAATMATVLALAPETGAAGARGLSAFALGCEAQLRIGNAISPVHYDRGWHITGTCGVFGAAVAAALLLGAGAEGLERALSLASVMTLGHREAFGSMTKPFHPGKAAVNGILAARLAAAGLAGGADPLGAGGVLSVLAGEVNRAELLDGPWDGGWELERNTFKPYPCGIVAHPLIDAAIEASRRLSGPAEIRAVSVTCNPLVPELMGRRQPADGLQARFSSYHAVAAGLLDGAAGLAQFADRRATAPGLARLRDLITLDPTSECPRDSATITVERAGGEPVTVTVPHARGSLARPLTDAELLAKVDGLVTPVLGSGAAETIAGAVDALGGAPDLSALLAVLRPREEKRREKAEEKRGEKAEEKAEEQGEKAEEKAEEKAGAVKAGAGPSAGAPETEAARPGAGEPDPGDEAGITPEIVKLVTSAAPSAAALEQAAAELALFGAARREGAGSEAATAIRRIAPPGPPAQWTAFGDAAAAVTASRPPEWAAVCAAAAALGDDPAQAAAAVAIGREAAATVAAGLGPAREAGWSLASAAGVIGAGAAAARLLRLSPEQTRNALGLCATQAAGLARAERTGAGAAQAGKAAADGIEAALLARAGFTSSRLPLEGRRGLFALLGGAG